MAQTFQEMQATFHLNLNYMVKGDMLLGSGTASNSTTSDSNILPVGASGSLLVANTTATYGALWSATKFLSPNWVNTYATTVIAVSSSTTGIPTVVLNSMTINTGTNTTSDYFYIYCFSSQLTTNNSGANASSYIISGIFVNGTEDMSGRTLHACGSQYEWGMQGNSGVLKSIKSNSTIAVYYGQGGPSTTFIIQERSLSIQRLNAQ